AGVSAESFGGSLAVCAGVGLVFVALMVLAGRWLGIPEIRELVRRGHTLKEVKGSRGRGVE
ncbi:MAG TPA: hypothetical protein VLH81_14250, partial [Desulfobacterales bacterium]|nr:hypothetical protein [Desulfobacterales bacterium]